MGISNQGLILPPDHPLAKELYDLQCAETAAMQPFIPGPTFDPSLHDECDKILNVIADAILFVQGQYRAERGADASCTVGLTYDADNRWPVVEGRSAIGEPFIHDKIPGPRKN